MTKNTTKTIFMSLILILILFAMPLTQAGECPYGTLNVYFSKDQQNWEQATVDNASAKRGETFYIKAEITSKIKLLSIDVNIWETGEDDAENSTFKILEGPACFFDVYDIIDVKNNESYTYTWKFQVKPDTEWVNATAPLNIFAQYDKNTQDNKKIYFTVVNLYIEDTLWEHYDSAKNYTGNIYSSNYSEKGNTSENATNESYVNKNRIPGYQAVTLILSLSIVIVFLLRKNHFFVNPFFLFFLNKECIL